MTKPSPKDVSPSSEKHLQPEDSIPENPERQNQSTKTDSQPMKANSSDSKNLKISEILSSPSRIFVIILSLPIHLYRLFISPILPNSCRFTPSCSAYSLQALSIHGLFKGLLLTVKRIARCHPWGGQGFDPVPPPTQTQTPPPTQTQTQTPTQTQTQTPPKDSKNNLDPNQPPNNIELKNKLENPSPPIDYPIGKFFRSNQISRFHHQQKEVSITAEPEFLLHHSVPEQEHFVWRCNITIHNKSESPLRLIRHHWQITGNDGSSFSVSDDQTSSNQPVLIKGVALLHSCTVPIATPSAFISGSYEMLDAKGQIVTINTPTFSLDSPWDEQHIN